MYKSVIITKHGGPEVLGGVEQELRTPAAGEVRIKVLAAGRRRPDITVYGATPIDCFTQDFVQVIRLAPSDGVDVVLDGMMRPATIRVALSLLKRGGRLVSFGEPSGFPALFAF